jgi:hypothetical protein
LAQKGTHHSAKTINRPLQIIENYAKDNTLNLNMVSATFWQTIKAVGSCDISAGY